MRAKKKVFNYATRLLKTGIKIVGGKKATLVSARLAEDLSPILAQKTNCGIIKFFCPGKIPEWRARTLLTKEPETIEWIETFHQTDTLWDIGANVGLYSLYAALRGLNVLAFEPSPSNYYVLSKNVEVNNMDDRISAFCIAFNDATRLDSFYMAHTEIGGALNSFGEALDWQGRTYVASLRQAMVGFSIDDFLEQFDPQFPNHIKIDVDGIENKIVKGAQNTLADKRLKSVLVELDEERRDYCNEVIEICEGSGLRLLRKEHASEFDNTQFSSVYNHIFRRSY